MGTVVHSDSTSFPRLAEHDGAIACCRVKVKWTTGDDQLLTELVHIQGARNWRVIASELGGRHTHNTCRQRSVTCLDPSVDRPAFTEQECAVIVRGAAEVSPEMSIRAEVHAS